jgi:OHCU decarboxylase
MPMPERTFSEAPSALTRDEFIARFGDIYEHSTWIAERIWDNRGPQLDTVEGLASAMASCVDAAPHEQRLALIRAHPDLAGRAAVAGELTADSTAEQTRAGIDQCSEEEFQRFQHLNAAYWDKFGFPFVMAVRNSNRQEILLAFETRLQNDAESEFRAAIGQIHIIARLRLDAMAPGNRD